MSKIAFIMKIIDFGTLSCEKELKQIVFIVVIQTLYFENFNTLRQIAA